MTIKTSFYLLTPQAREQSKVYISIRNKKLGRLRFASNLKFIASYCNNRATLGRRKDLVKKNTPFYISYNKQLQNTRDMLLMIEQGFIDNNTPYTLEDIRDSYYLKIGFTSPETNEPNEDKYIKDLFVDFINYNKAGWTESTLKSFNSCLNHISSYCTKSGNIKATDLGMTFWKEFRDNYLVNQGFSNNTANKYLKILKQFLNYLVDEKIMPSDLTVGKFTYLEMIEPYKIALTESEVDTLLNYDLSNNLRLANVRDLFLLEVLTGQRISDLPKILNKEYYTETAIEFHQQKTGQFVSIPIYPALKKHLDSIFKKHPLGLTSIISDQKFNNYLKELCKKVGVFNQKHTWTIQNGTKKTTVSDYRYNLITSHTGRRSFCTLSLKRGIKAEMIMKVSGHKTYSQFSDYVKVNDIDVQEAFNTK